MKGKGKLLMHPRGGKNCCSCHLGCSRERLEKFCLFFCVAQRGALEKWYQVAEFELANRWLQNGFLERV